MFSLCFHWALVIGVYSHVVASDSPPHLCEYKWKHGKESVFCLNANLTSIPLHLDGGTQVLDLTGNNLSTLKHDVFSKVGLLNLQKVFISKCRLKTIERFAFRKLINLIELDLSYNALSTVPSLTFNSIPELRELKLSGNPIQRLLDDAFTGVPQLTRLELSDCRLTTIEHRAFAGLGPALHWLKLDRNNLVEVKSSSFTGLENLHELELAGNPWNCTCGLRPLREWMLRHNVPCVVPPVCRYPKRLDDRPWDKLELDEFACIPEAFAYESKTHGVEGRNVTMACRVAGIPEPSVRWSLKNKVIANANLTGSYNSGGKKLYVVRLQNHSSDLTIFSADLQDAGVYVCAAENKAGRVEASVTLAVTRKPPEVAFSNKVLAAGVITGTALVLASCVIALCVYSVRKKQVLTWRERECRDDNYEKIEMNHHGHKASGNANGGAVGGGGGEVAVVAATRKNGDYRVVPVADDAEPDKEDEEDGGGGCPVAGSGGEKWAEGGATERRWNSPEHLLDPEDLHIPRRTLQEARGDIRKTYISTFGTYNNPPAPTSSATTTASAQPPPPVAPRRQILAATFNSDLSSLAEEKKYPDLIENSGSSYKFCTPSATRANSVAGGSMTDVTEIFCTLPRKRMLIQSSRYRSNDSQSPLLPDSRYASSSGSSSLDLGRMSASDSANSNSHRVTKVLSTSYLNLTSDCHQSATPLLDVSSLESRVHRQKDLATSPVNANSYDYHAAQLERFLEEYRSLQKQLTRMKETCDNLCQDHLLRVTPSTSQDNNAVVSPNSNESLEDSIDFRNFESELTKYLLAKGGKTFGGAAANAGDNTGGVFNN